MRGTRARSAGSRMFVAALPPDDVVDSLEEFLDPRRSAAAYRWTPAEQWHITLAFAAAVPDRSVDTLVELLGDVATRNRPLELRIAGGGAFPNVTAAQVLYAGLTATPEDLADLERIAVGARSAVNRSGAEVDGGRFRPHVTVARSGHPMESTPWVRLLDGYAGPAWRVEELALVESHLGEGPRRRPRHDVVARFPLGP